MPNAVYAGTFDICTNGHLWVVETAAKLFSRLFVAVAINPDKHGKHYFTDDERVLSMHEAVAHIPNAFVVQMEAKSLLVNFARKTDAQFLVRGIRDHEDYRIERALRHMNAKLEPKINTVFLMPPKDLEEISSSFVKGLIGIEGWENIVCSMVPANVHKMICNRHHTLLKIAGQQCCQ